VVLAALADATQKRELALEQKTSALWANREKERAPRQYLRFAGGDDASGASPLLYARYRLHHGKKRGSEQIQRAVAAPPESNLLIQSNRAREKRRCAEQRMRTAVRSRKMLDML
jgi:hypothetical protein